MTRAFDPKPPLRQDCDEIFSPLTGAASSGNRFGAGLPPDWASDPCSAFSGIGDWHRFGDGRGRQTHRFVFVRVAAMAGQQHPCPQSGQQDGQQPDQSWREEFWPARSRPGLKNDRRARGTCEPGKPRKSRQSGEPGQFDAIQPTVHRHAIDRWRNGCCLLRRTAAGRCGDCSFAAFRSILEPPTWFHPNVSILEFSRRRLSSGLEGWRCRHATAKIDGAASCRGQRTAPAGGASIKGEQRCRSSLGIMSICAVRIPRPPRPGWRIFSAA